MLRDIMNKNTKLVIGLMSGTSGDGVDAVLCEITGHGIETKVKQLAFVSNPYTKEVRDRILQVAGGFYGGAKELCMMNVFLSEMFADACEELCLKAGVKTSDIDLIGSHGQTVYHVPIEEEYLGRKIRATYQIGEASTLVERIGAITVSDFRTRDLAAGGLGAPLVPYTEYILYSDPERNMGLQNIGGIGNITVIPKKAKLEELTAFDTGPGNMVMDNVIYRLTNGAKSYDDGGKMAASGCPNDVLLAELMKDPYLAVIPPKTTGREYYGNDYVDKIMAKAAELNMRGEDILSTVTMFTAKTISHSIQNLCAVKPDRLVVGGGGSMNPTLLSYIADSLPGVEVMTNEDLGFDSNAKEAVAFALLANECIHGVCNTAVGATGAKHPVIMGKISQ